MQTGGIGSNHSDMHHVTTCVHNHKHVKQEKVGGAAGAKQATAEQLNSAQNAKAEGFSLSNWLQNTLSGARKLLGRIWGVDVTAASGEVNAQKCAETTAQLHSSQIEVATSNVQPAQNYNNNPYFATITEDRSTQQSIAQKVRVRFRGLAGFMAKRFPFSNGGAFQTRQERPKEDLRRHSHYRKDDVEIDCIITDDSYLMDSYNKKGEYSKLSAGK